ncbi:hypothetical protein [Paractinoplanes durhamensis]|uniref:Uncharacterized protein n=1 Tax=Paractinoplanes durhamensis TaxID=113563 RepID=A0ABQ3YQE4_9ACTN|nr:hypothetical protein [Actinoplanes durhamensis]GID99809.1 hypothetical protein Adu01nite_11600 [Actinoplanes durhamensis]
MTTAERVNLLVPADVVPRFAIPATAGTPAALRGGDLFLRGVPAADAERWIEQNPGVRTVSRRPVVRRYRARDYTVAAVVVLVVAVQAVIVPAVDGVENPMWLWLVGPALFAAGISLAYRSIPFGHVRFS